MVAFDATMLTILIYPKCKPPADKEGKPVVRFQERVQYLVETLDKKREKIIIPTPSLSEVLVIADAAGSAYLNQINNSAKFKISPFDERAAIEASVAIRNALQQIPKKDKKKI